MKRHALAAAILIFWVVPTFAQQSADVLVARMRQHESSILRTYLEYQKLYYEDKSRTFELGAFEELLTAYIEQVMEIYETLNLTERQSPAPRDIAARVLIFKALTFLEKAPLNSEYYEKACYEYYEALSLYEGTDEPPVLFKDLPQPIRAGETTYYRLVDLLEDKGQGLKEFGKVVISFRNFRVTANFNPERIRLRKLDNAPDDGFTYLLAESRIKQAFTEVFRRTREVETYVALPRGTYVITLERLQRQEYDPLTRFYVLPNQQQNCVIEPLDEWLILYQLPAAKRPDFYRFKRNHQLAATTFASGDVPSNGTGIFDAETNHDGTDSKEAPGDRREKLVAEIVAYYLPQYQIRLMFDLNDPEIKDNAIGIITKAIVEYLDSGKLYTVWSHWAASWEIAKEVREIISPGSVIPIELLKLIHTILQEL